MQTLLDQGIASKRGVMCTHRSPAYTSEPWRCGDHADACTCAPSTCQLLIQSERAEDRSLMLPLFTGLSEADQDRGSPQWWVRAVSANRSNRLSIDNLESWPSRGGVGLWWEDARVTRGRPIESACRPIRATTSGITTGRAASWVAPSERDASGPTVARRFAAVSPPWRGRSPERGRSRRLRHRMRQ